MPSFAQWIDTSQNDNDGDEDGEKCTTVPTTRAVIAPMPKQGRLPTDGGGVDMTDIAVMYDAQMASTSMKRPLSPVEKVFFSDAHNE